MAKTVLITGCSSGFGRASARMFGGRGWNVVATMRDTADAGDLADNNAILVTRLDVADQSSIDPAIAAGIHRFGVVDAVVNNAGYGLFSIFEGTTRAAIQRQFDVNLFGMMDVTRAILPHFRSNGEGTIINVSSGAGVFGAPMASIYSASKFAVEGFSEALWYELAALGIKVKLIEPGGAPGTGFMVRSGAEGSNVPIDFDYSPFLEHISRVYGSMAGGADPDAVLEVAAAIFEAATDGTDRLRYIPTSDVQPIFNARRHTSEEQYQTLVRSLFAM
ncbi:short-chain dehydrogenase [Mesorhizobium sp. Root102]|uniref:SDR family oxidoreductase n=1 Tax=Mesorhizobium sp. Root102 TaxID=1736422 RepID=UPI0007022754|nr:SDR family oxidoreductase [Mesorhizobium sp. Root102]KQU83323.1 short-chain dehydrogenase [Mesorhizobium sp. Root102]